MRWPLGVDATSAEWQARRARRKLGRAPRSQAEPRQANPLSFPCRTPCSCRLPFRPPRRMPERPRAPSRRRQGALRRWRPSADRIPRAAPNGDIRSCGTAEARCLRQKARSRSWSVSVPGCEPPRRSLPIAVGVPWRLGNREHHPAIYGEDESAIGVNVGHATARHWRRSFRWRSRLELGGPKAQDRVVGRTEPELDLPIPLAGVWANERRRLSGPRPGR
jgi:hypothetical protein